MAIDDLLDEHEQSEKVRSWLRANGAGLIGGVVLGLALIGGWQWWQGQQQQARVQTAEQYQAAVGMIQARQFKPAQARVASLSNPALSTLAALELAKAQLDAGQRDAAIATLRAAKPSEPALAAVVAQRLSRLLIDAGKAADALKLLPADSIDPEALQIRGDAEFALGHADRARAAYALALTHLDVAAPQRRLIELKLSEVGGAPAQPEAKT
jgi:predicted negative regulator of RcsB-dependent stress response